MLLFSIWVITLLTLFSTISTEDSLRYNKLPHYASNDRVHTLRTGRFGFDFLDYLRKQICQSFCTVPEARERYPLSVIFLLKCPELFFSNCSKTTTPTPTPTPITTPTSTPTTTPTSTPTTTPTSTPTTTPTSTPTTTPTSTPTPVQTTPTSTPSPMMGTQPAINPSNVTNMTIPGTNMTSG